MTPPTDPPYTIPPVDCVLLAPALSTQVRDTLSAEFPRLRFVHLEPDGSVPGEARGAQVLLRKGMSHDALHLTLDGAPALRWIHTASAGFDWVLTPRVIASGVVLSRTANVIDKPIAEFVVALALALYKQVPAFLASQRAHRWERPRTLRTLVGGTVGIVGAGAIGREAAKRFRALGAQVLGIKRNPEELPEFDRVLGPEGLPILLEQADLLVLACPHTPETHHLLGRREFASMKPSAMLVNIARGAIVVEDELIEALRDGVIAGAALDVFTTEPLPADSPLWDLPNVILTPHAAPLSDHNEEGIIAEFAANLHRYLAGEPLTNTLKSPELGY